MISILISAGFLLLLLYVFRRRPFMFVLAFFLLFGFVLRVVAIGYVDAEGPIFATELERYIGGNEGTLPFVTFIAAFLVPYFFLFRNPVKRIAGRIETLDLYGQPLRNVALAGAAVIVAALYAEMLFMGPIPLFAGIDRQEYAQAIAGPLYRQMYGNGGMFMFGLGMLATLPRLLGGNFEFRTFFIVLAQLVFWGLTGNRFSAFFRDLSFFIMPFAAVMLWQTAGRLRTLQGFSSFLASRYVVAVVIGMLSVAVGMLLYNSFFNVRAYADTDLAFSQRVLVQPVETFATSWERLDFRGTGPNPAVWHDVFVEPINAEGNPAVQALMIQDLGYARAAELISIGQQYAGGYPEILIELFGLWPAFPLALLAGFATAWLLRLALTSFARGRLLTAFMANYLYFGFSVFYIGGFVNFILAPTYWAKIVVLLVVMIFERGRSARHLVMHPQGAR